MSREIPAPPGDPEQPGPSPTGGGIPPPPGIPPLSLLVQDVDRGIIRMMPVLEIRLGNTLHLTPVGTQHVPETSIHSAPVILNFAETTVGFEMGSSDDHVRSFIVTAINGRIPIFGTAPGNLPISVVYGRLTDYLAQITRAGSDDFPPGLSTFYYTPDAPGQDLPENRIYVFRGTLEEFEVSDDSQIVTMRFIEDLRWDRATPYVIDQKKYSKAPPESVGLPFPICYGNFGLWEHKDWVAFNQQPFTPTRGFFPGSLNAATTIPVHFEQGASPGYTGQLITHENVNEGPPFFPVVGYKYRAATVNSEGLITMVEPDDPVTTIAGLQVDDTAGMTDLQYGLQLILAADWSATAVILPVKETNEANNAGATPNVTTIFSANHVRDRSHMVDGDRFSYFKDDVNSTTTRRIIWELAVERNLGAIIDMRVVVHWRKRNAVAGNLTFLAKIDRGANAGESVSASTTVPDTIGIAGFGVVELNIAGLLTAEPRTERWEFVQGNSTPRGRGMLLTFEWSKSVGSIILDIHQVSLVIKFNPSRFFVENRPRIEGGWTSIPGQERRKYRQNHVKPRTVLVRDRILGAQSIRPGRGGYVGFGFGGTPDVLGDDLWVGADSSYNKAIQNPADVIRHAMAIYGGAFRSDAPSGWPPIKYADFEQTVPVRSFATAKLALDNAVREATNAATETFKIAVSIPNYRTVKDIARLILDSVPNLQLTNLPTSSSADTGFARPSFGLIFPKPGDPTTFRRLISPTTDMSRFTWMLTPQAAVMNDIKIRYGFSAPLGNYMRNLVAKGGDGAFPGLLDHGWPVLTTNGGGTETDATDALNLTMKSILDASFSYFGPKEARFELPFIYRWYEALAIRNSLIRWFALPRVRIIFTARIDIADLLPGDVFALNNDADSYIDCVFPLLHLPTPSSSWNGQTFLVERITYAPADDGALAMTVQAIWNGRLVE